MGTTLGHHMNPLSKLIRSRPIRSPRIQHRAYHLDQPYSHFTLQLSPASDSVKLPLELPPPTSPTRPRRYRLRRTWGYAFFSYFRLANGHSSSTIYLALYFSFNLGLTLYNKSLLIHFPFPYTLSAIHALCGSIGSLILTRIGSSPPPRLNFRETLILLAFSVLYTVNIIVSNVSLGLVTIPVSRLS